MKQNFRENKVATGKTSFFMLIILFVLTLTFDMALLYGNDVFSILVLSTKKRYSSFLKKVFVFQKICFKVKVLKTFKISTDKNMPISQTKGYFESPEYHFLEDFMLLLLALKQNLQEKLFPSNKTKTNPNFAVKLVERSNHSFLLSL